MKFKLTDEFPNGSCLQGYIDESYDRLVEVFGEPNSDGDEYKVQKEWVIEFADGTIATIYDYKEGDAYNGEGQGKHYTQVTDWHVGGRNQRAVMLVSEALDGMHEAGDIGSGSPRYTEDEIATAAESACFYVTPDGLWLRVDYCNNDEGYFQAHDENSGEEYNFYYNELVYETPEFHKLVKVTI